MACEARIVRVLRTLEYPGLGDSSASPSPTVDLANRPHDLAKIVSWIEDRKVRGLAISDRTPLRTPGPNWEAAFFGYLQEMGCPYDFKSIGKGGEAGSSSGMVLRGLSWLVTEAVACDFEDNGKEYMASARQLLLNKLPPPPTAGAGGSEHPGSPSDVVAMDDGSEGGKRSSFDVLNGFAAGVETGDEACDGVATVLRMLFLSDLRDLQDDVNGVIALAQSSRTEHKR